MFMFEIFISGYITKKTYLFAGYRVNGSINPTYFCFSCLRVRADLPKQIDIIHTLATTKTIYCIQQTTRHNPIQVINLLTYEDRHLAWSNKCRNGDQHKDVLHVFLICCYHSLTVT